MAQTTEFPRFLSINEAALRAGVSANAVRTWIDRGALPTAQAVPNGKHLIRESDLVDLLTPRRHG